MIKRLSINDISQVVKIHKEELHGFLSELGEGFLTKFYQVSLDIPEMFTLIEKENEQVLGFVSFTTSAKGLYKKVIAKEFLSFVLIFLRYFITHPESIVKSVRILTYPGFKDDSPELITIAVFKVHQGKGIGRKLFMAVVKEFKKKGFRKFKVSAYGENELLYI
ncbi:GNAT family N-acetyltransferase [Candidatus Gottesmanbacteria bacterium]|nr:GNAT family N-acetyltransferase [Candidatus Gottesmanbacteria bacterium]